MCLCMGVGVGVGVSGYCTCVLRLCVGVGVGGYIGLHLEICTYFSIRWSNSGAIRTYIRYVCRYSMVGLCSYVYTYTAFTITITRTY